ncbi:MAG: class I SAM-dependent methyltransferase [Gemmatimonadota bacterium]|nr:class I SAM-dependent methyltransferase [Gemmatimonadota bacterium]
MNPILPNSDPHWQEPDSRSFLDYGRYFVPHRDAQISMICDLIPNAIGPWHALELGCGEGLLAREILDRFPACHVHALDASPAMLARATATLADYGGRFTAEPADLAVPGWRTPPWPVHAVVSSLALHHLNGAGKARLFSDVARCLSPGGVLIIADVVRPGGEMGRRMAERRWDQAVRERARTLDGNLEAYRQFREGGWNMYSMLDADPIDKPSTLLEQLRWLGEAGFAAVDVFWMEAGHAIFGGAKPAEEGGGGDSARAGGT